MSTEISRRQLLVGGTAAAAGLAIGSLATAPGAWAGVPATSDHFDLVAGSKPLFANATLREPKWNPQSLGFDNVTRRIYFTAVKETSTPNGDLWLTQTDFNGTMTGSMALHGFGHGTMLGVQPSGSGAYIWSEADFDAATKRSRRIVRFPFRNGATIESNSSGVVDRTPPGLYDKYPTVSIDPVYNNLIVGYNATGAKQMQIYDLTDASSAKPTWKVLGSVALSHSDPVTDSSVYGSWQGITALGRYLYLLQGPSPSDRTKGYWTIYDLVTHKRIDRNYATSAYSQLPSWEPQGAAIMPTSAGARLCCAISSQPTSGQHTVSVAYKDHLISS